VFVAIAASAGAEPPPFQQQISRWAKSAGYELGDYKNCVGLEESHFGSMGSVCWHVARQHHPHLDITLSVFADESAAKKRIARFHDKPEGVTAKTFPLRAAFRVGDRIVLVTTDTSAFERDAYDAAIGLAKAIGGTELTCWNKCEPTK
jgi:hypothetical protein